MNARTFLSATDSKTLQHDQFTLFPMPFTSEPTLKYNLKGTETISVEVLTVTGQILSSKVFVSRESSTIKMDEFTAFPPGIYFVRISSGTSRQVISAVKI